MGEDLFGHYPVVVRIPVQWGEMDAYGHVNNAVFFRYFESARMEYLERCGFLESYERDRIGAILHSTSCRFRRPLFYPDTAVIGTRAAEIQDDRFTMLYEVVSLASGEQIAEGSGIVVSYDYESRRKAAIPGWVRARIRDLEGGAPT